MELENDINTLFRLIRNQRQGSLIHYTHLAVQCSSFPDPAMHAAVKVYLSHLTHKEGKHPLRLAKVRKKDTTLTKHYLYPNVILTSLSLPNSSSSSSSHALCSTTFNPLGGIASEFLFGDGIGDTLGEPCREATAAGEAM